MPTPEQIRESLESMAKRHAPPVTNIAEVQSVDIEAATCVLADEDGQEFFDVRLRPVLTGNSSFLMVPKVGTSVLAVRIEDDEDWMVMACDEFTSVSWTIDGLAFVLNDKATISKGSVKIELADKIKIEANGQNMANLIDSLFLAIQAMVFVTPSGNTTTLLNTAQFETLKTQFNQLLN